MTPIVAGLFLGLATSAHCVAMCGPLMLAVRQAAPGRTWSGVWLYHVGRLAAYSLLGVVVGVLGAGVGGGGFGRALSMVAGATLIAAAALRVFAPWRGPSSGRAGSWLGGAWARVRRATTSWGRGGLFAAGAANAFLPCGLLWAALLGAGALGSALQAAQAMAAFGVGTTPAVVAAWWSIGAVRWLRPARFAGLTPAILAITGMLLVARGVWPPSHEHTARVPVATATHQHAMP